MSKQKYSQTNNNKRVIYHIDSYPKSPKTREMYVWHFNTFLKHWGFKEDRELLRLETRDLEAKIISYLCDYLAGERKLKKSTIETAMSAIFYFCTMNDLPINRKKISMLIPPNESRRDDRSYTRDEIAELLRQSTDERFRAVIYLLANGLRVGAIPELELGDRIPWSIGPKGEILDNDTGKEKLYQILVYNRSVKDRYYTFVTPECRQAIDKYLESRKGKGENISIKHSPLIREQFTAQDSNSKNHPKKLTVQAFKKGIERTIERANLGTVGEVMMTHGFRKFAITQMIKAKVDYENREFLVGHKTSRGLDTSYGKLEPDERLLDWSQAINLLTIDKTLILEKKLQVLEGAQQQTIVELKQQIDRLQNTIYERDRKIYERDRKRMGFYDAELKPVAEGKKREITKEQWLKDLDKEK